MNEKEGIVQNFYYDPSKDAPLEEFRYEWVATGEVFPWQFYYGLAYWRFERGEGFDFSLPYFLVKNKKGRDCPSFFALENSRGNRWIFERINDRKDFSLPFNTLDPLPSDINGAIEEILSLKRTLEEQPWRGWIYVLKPLDEGSPLDWSTLRLLYEEAQNREIFTFEWQEQPMSPIDSFGEPDCTRFHFQLSEEGFQIFMRTLKRWGIS